MGRERDEFLKSLFFLFSRYFGAARDLPGVRELFETEREEIYFRGTVVLNFV